MRYLLLVHLDEEGFRKLSDEEHGRVRLHFYPFGALTPSAEWINQYDAKHS